MRMTCGNCRFCNSISIFSKEGICSKNHNLPVKKTDAPEAHGCHTHETMADYEVRMKRKRD